MCALGLHGQTHKHQRQWHFAHVQNCPGDQEYGWWKTGLVDMVPLIAVVAYHMLVWRLTMTSSTPVSVVANLGIFDKVTTAGADAQTAAMNMSSAVTMSFSVWPVDPVPGWKRCLPRVCANFPTVVVGVTCHEMISWLTMSMQTFAKATEMPQCTARSQRWQWASWLEPVINEAFFLIELMSNKEAGRQESHSMNYTFIVPTFYVTGTLSSASLRASISEGQSCLTDGPC